MTSNFRPGYLQRGAPLGATRKQVMLSADNQTIDVTGVGYLELSSDNTTATNRTFSLTSPTLVGQSIELVLISGSSTTCELADSGNCKLSSTWTPSQYDALSLMWNGTYWIETGRSSSTGSLTIPLTSAYILVGNASNVAAGVAMSGDATVANTGALTIANDAVTTVKIDDEAVTTAKIDDEAVTTAKIDDAGVTLAKLATGIAPSHVVKFAGKHTTTASATNAVTVTGVAATDIVFAQMQTVGASPVTLVTAAPTTNTVTFVFSGDPSTDHIVAYQVLRAAT